MKAWSMVCLLFTLVCPAVAQEQDDKEKKKRFVRFLPLGESPPFRQEIRDGVRYEQEPEPGSIPPPMVKVLLGEKPAIDTTLRLEQFSEKIEIPDGATRVTVQEMKVAESEIWHQANLPEEGDAVVCLWRDPEKKTWEKARSLVIPDSVTAFPQGTIRLINLLPTKVLAESETGRIELGPGTMKVIPLKKETTPMRISAMDVNKEWRVVYQSGVTQNDGERGNLVVYRADGEAPRSPVKVWVGRERVMK